VNENDGTVAVDVPHTPYRAPPPGCGTVAQTVGVVHRTIDASPTIHVEPPVPQTAL
jgi:hypothetical protein